MQRIFSRTAIIGVVGTAILVPFIYSQATRSVSADSDSDSGQGGKPHNNNNNNKKETFGLPSTMLFSKRLTVMAVEQMNHDTKRITFALPGGLEESSGVPVSGEPSLERVLRLTTRAETHVCGTVLSSSSDAPQVPS
jgi:hypothetical protein